MVITKWKPIYVRWQSVHKIVGQVHMIPLAQVHVTSLSPPTLKNEAHENQPSYGQVEVLGGGVPNTTVFLKVPVC